MNPLTNAARLRAPDQPRAAISCTRTASGAVVCRLTGDIDPDAAPAVTRALVTALDDGKPSELYVDLADVEYFSAAGLTALLILRDCAAAASVPMTLMAPGRMVSRVLEGTDTRHLFTVSPRLQPARDAR